VANRGAATMEFPQSDGRLSIPGHTPSPTADQSHHNTRQNMIDKSEGSLLPTSITVTFENAADRQIATFRSLGHISQESLPADITVGTFMRFLRDQFMAHHGAHRTMVYIYEGEFAMMEIILT
jgi:hypothetical protein